MKGGCRSKDQQGAAVASNPSGGHNAKVEPRVEEDVESNPKIVGRWFGRRRGWWGLGRRKNSWCLIIVDLDTGSDAS